MQRSDKATLNKRKVVAMGFRFEKLDVWKRAVAMYRVVCEQSAKFPQNEEYVLTRQLRRAALSIPTNIAEAMGRETVKERRYLLTVARGSIFETANLVLIASEMGYVSLGNTEIKEELVEIAKMINGLIKAQK